MHLLPGWGLDTPSLTNTDKFGFLKSYLTASDENGLVMATSRCSPSTMLSANGERWFGHNIVLFASVLCTRRQDFGQKKRGIAKFIFTRSAFLSYYRGLGSEYEISFGTPITVQKRGSLKISLNNSPIMVEFHIHIQAFIYTFTLKHSILQLTN